MKHKYLHELFHDFEFLPFPFSAEDYPEFDKRDTLSLDSTFVAWLYERLRFFQDEVSKVVDFTFHKFMIDGIEGTQREWIDKMVVDCEIILLADWDENYDTVNNAKNDLLKIFSALFFTMWW